jgi:hypothetical protein
MKGVLLRWGALQVSRRFLSGWAQCAFALGRERAMSIHQSHGMATNAAKRGGKHCNTSKRGQRRCREKVEAYGHDKSDTGIR